MMDPFNGDNGWLDSPSTSQQQEPAEEEDLPRELTELVEVDVPPEVRSERPAVVKEPVLQAAQEMRTTVLTLFPQEVLFRIEDFLLWYLEEASQGRLPVLELVGQPACVRHTAPPVWSIILMTVRQTALKLCSMSATDCLLQWQVSRTAVNSTLVADGSQQAGDEDDTQFTLRLQQGMQMRSLTNRQAEGAYPYVRIFKIMGANLHAHFFART